MALNRSKYRAISKISSMGTSCQPPAIMQARARFNLNLIQIFSFQIWITVASMPLIVRLLLFPHILKRKTILSPTNFIRYLIITVRVRL